MSEVKSTRSIQSVQRAIDIINCFDHINSELTLGQISTRLNLNKSTVHGILNTLWQNDLVSQTAAGKYTLGGYLIRKLGQIDFSLRNLLKEKSVDAMGEVANRYGTSCGLFILEQGELVMVNRVQPENEVYAISTHLTYIRPLYCSASGKLLLATMDQNTLDGYLAEHPLAQMTEHTITTHKRLLEELDMVREEGFGEENEELGIGVYALAVPITNHFGQMVATIGATGMAGQIRDKKEEIVRDLKKISAEISHQIFNS